MSHPAPQGLRCHVEPDRDRVVVRAVGEVDMATVDVIGKPLDELRANGFTQIEIDLREVTFMDSTGLRLLVNWRRRALADGFDLQIVLDPDGPVARVVELTGLQEVLLNSPVAQG
ncbi:MAG: STAS domain-containing protein [Baekduia sp.]